MKAAGKQLQRKQKRNFDIFKKKTAAAAAVTSKSKKAVFDGDDDLYEVVD